MSFSVILILRCKLHFHTPVERRHFYHLDFELIMFFMLYKILFDDESLSNLNFFSFAFYFCFGLLKLLALEWREFSDTSWESYLRLVNDTKLRDLLFPSGASPLKQLKCEQEKKRIVFCTVKFTLEDKSTNNEALTLICFIVHTNM